MKFLVLTQYFPPEIGASQVRLAAVCEELIRAGHSVEVVTAMPHHPLGRIFPEYRGAFLRREHFAEIPVYRTWVYAGNRSSAARLLSYLSFTVTSLLAALQVEKPDYVFTDSPPLFLGVSGWIAAKWWGARFIFNVADLWPDSVRDLGIMKDGILMRMAQALEGWIYSCADYVTAVTEGIRCTLIEKKNVSPEKVLFLPNGVDTHLFESVEPDLSLKRELGLEGKRVVLYAGNHGYAGGLDQLVEAAELLRNESSIHFLLIGDGPEKLRLRHKVLSLGLTNVTFHDSVPIANLPAFTSICDLAVVTLRKAKITEGARPAKTFVMMAAGKAIVLAAQGEAAHLIESAGAGVVVPPESPVALAAAIQDLASDPVKAAHFGSNGRAFVKNQFEWSKLVRKWLAQLPGAAAAAQSSRPLEPIAKNVGESA